MEHRSMKNYYYILGLDQRATLREIKKQTFLLGKAHHPTQEKGATIDSKSFIEIIEANYILTEPKTKEVYDWLLDHENGKILLREEAINKHRKIIESASNEGKTRGELYSKLRYSKFKDDYKSKNWRNIIEVFNFIGELFTAW